MSKRHTLGVSKWLPSTKDKITFKITLRPSTPNISKHLCFSSLPPLPSILRTSAANLKKYTQFLLRSITAQCIEGATFHYARTAPWTFCGHPPYLQWRHAAQSLLLLLCSNRPQLPLEQIALLCSLELGQWTRSCLLTKICKLLPLCVCSSSMPGLALLFGYSLSIFKWTHLILNAMLWDCLWLHIVVEYSSKQMCSSVNAMYREGPRHNINSYLDLAVWYFSIHV